MTRHHPAPAFAQRLLPAPEAAHYLGISESTLRLLGLPRLKIGAKRLYDRYALDEFASNLPGDGTDSAGGDNSCDAAFGVTR